MRSGHITTGAGARPGCRCRRVRRGRDHRGRLGLDGLPRVFTTHSTAAPERALDLRDHRRFGGDGGLIKRAPGLGLSGANGYGGFTRVEARTSVVPHAQALGIAAADAGTGVLADGVIVLARSSTSSRSCSRRAAPRTTHSSAGAGREGVDRSHPPDRIEWLLRRPTCTLRLGRHLRRRRILDQRQRRRTHRAGSNYVGDTRVQSGTLRIDGSNRLPDTTVRPAGPRAF